MCTNTKRLNCNASNQEASRCCTSGESEESIAHRQRSMQMRNSPWLWSQGRCFQKSTKNGYQWPQDWSHRYPSSIQPLQSGTTFVAPNTSHQLNKLSRNMRLEVKHPMTICLNRHYPGGSLNWFRFSASWPHFHMVSNIFTLMGQSFIDFQMNM